MIPKLSTPELIIESLLERLMLPKSPKRFSQEPSPLEEIFGEDYYEILCSNPSDPLENQEPSPEQQTILETAGLIKKYPIKPSAHIKPTYNKQTKSPDYPTAATP